MRDLTAAGRLRKHLAAALTLAVLVWSAGPVLAEGEGDSPEKHPGYFPLEELDFLDPDQLSLEINLHRPMLRIVAAVTKSSDPAFSQLLANLESVRVRVAPLEGVDGEKVRAGMTRAGRWLQDRGWQTIVRSREEGEHIHVYLREDDGEIVGVAVLAIDGSEATLLNIAGLIDLAQVVKLGEQFDISLLGELDIEAGDEPAQDATPQEKKP